MKAKGYFFAILSAVSYGLIPLFAIPLKEQDMPFDTVLFYRFFFASLLIGIYLFIRKTNLRISKKELFTLVLLGIVFSLSSTFLFLGYDYLSAGAASTILFMYPVFVAVLMRVFFKEKLSWITVLAIIMAFIGVMILSKKEGCFNIDFVGLIIVLLSALFYALYIVIINKSNVNKMSGAKLTMYSMFFCSMFFMVKTLTQGESQLLPSFSSVGFITLFALVTTVISCITLVYAIQYIGSTPTAILGALEPVVAVCVSVVLFHEPFTHNLVIGILLILVAVILNILSDRILASFRFIKRTIRKRSG